MSRIAHSNFDLKEEIRAYWSARSIDFDESPSHRIEDRYGMPEWQSFLRQAAGLKDSETMDGLRVLDLACGTGEISRMLCSLGAHVTGLDFSESMLKKAQAKLSDQNWVPLLCDAEDLKRVTDASVDFATTRHLAWTLTNPEAAYREWHRVLKPEGRLLINDGNWSQPLSRLYRLKRRIAHWIQPELPRSEEDLQTDNLIRTQLPYRAGLTKDLIISDLEACGFRLQQELDTVRLYGRGMRGWPLAQRLRQSAENRFALVFEK